MNSNKKVQTAWAFYDWAKSVLQSSYHPHIFSCILRSSYFNRKFPGRHKVFGKNFCEYRIKRLHTCIWLPGHCIFFAHPFRHRLFRSMQKYFKVEIHFFAPAQARVFSISVGILEMEMCCKAIHCNMFSSNLANTPSRQSAVIAPWI